MKIKIHNSLALKNDDNDYWRWTNFILNYIYLEYFPTNERLYFYSKISDHPVGSLEKDSSLKEYSYIGLTPLNLKSIKSWKWKSMS